MYNFPEVYHILYKTLTVMAFGAFDFKSYDPDGIYRYTYGIWRVCGVLKDFVENTYLTNTMCFDVSVKCRKSKTIMTP